MLSLLKKKNANSMAAIVSDEYGTAVVSIRNSRKSGFSLQSCEFEPADSRAPGLNDKLLKGRGLDRQTCSTLLNIGEYQLLVIDAPDVPPQELRSAVRWKIQELIDFPVDDAVLDVFDAPPGGPAGTSEQVYVVVARKATVRDRIDRLEQYGLNLQVIDIPELAMRNLAARLPEDQSGLVTLCFSQQQCLITLTHNATLFLTRTVDFKFGDLGEQPRHPSDSSNRLALEIQRSLDYYEQHFQKAAIRCIAILPPPAGIDGLDGALQQSLGLTIRSVTLNDVIDSDRELDPKSAATCMLAAGCALRTEYRTL